MISLKAAYSRINFLPVFQRESKAGRKYFYWFCTFWLLIAFLELGQDYISSILNNNQFRLIESLSYKLFWILFIPFSMTIFYGLELVDGYSSEVLYFAYNIFLAVVITLIHLIIFSFFLFGISNIIHQDPWSLFFLISEKLSTRLYIGLSVYTALSAIYFFSKRKESAQNQYQQEYSKNITIKNGQRSVLVAVGEIKWISSDGPYLNIHIADKKHVILGSLKNIITTLPENFKRIHRSTIVNIEMISELESRGNGDYDIIMDNNQKLRLSRNYAKPLKELLL